MTQKTPKHFISKRITFIAFGLLILGVAAYSYAYVADKRFERECRDYNATPRDIGFDRDPRTISCAPK